MSSTFSWFILILMVLAMVACADNPFDAASWQPAVPAILQTSSGTVPADL